MKFLRSRRGLAALAAVLLLLFLFRPGVRELRDRIAGSIGSALGRRVALDNVRIHVLPRPGFDLEGLVIYDDPAFSAEPMVRAQDVSAEIRLRSLLRGRLEIATLSATEPSINLVRNDQGRWNLASLLERNARIPAAPTGKPASERRPAFPYLEATHARINFKIGQAKKSWALTDGDVALWQESDNTWSARMKAQPVRTDFNLTDTGVIQLNATWQRASNLSETPLQIELQWQNGQLGQITKLFSGGDRGWRGGVSLRANFTGTPRALVVQSRWSVDEFRRYDIMSSGVRLSAACGGRYSTEDGVLRELSCESPVNEGSLRLRGNVGPVKRAPAYDLTLTAEKVPLSSLMGLVRQTKKGLPVDLIASGRLDAELHAVGSPLLTTKFTGGGTASDVHLSSNGGKDEFILGTIPLTARNGSAIRAKMINAGARRPEDDLADANLQIGPFPLALGGSAPANAGAWISATAYGFSLQGDTAIKNLYRLADTLGIVGFRPLAEGSARVDANVDGLWQGLAPPQVTGTAQLRNVRAGMRGLNPPIDIASAILNVGSDTLSFEKLNAQTGDTHWTGTVTAPRHCPPEGCEFQFELSADELSSSGFAEWFTPHPARRPWYRMLAVTDPLGPSPLLGLRAIGRLRVNRLNLKTVDVSQIFAQVNLDRGGIVLKDIHGQVFQGTYLGSWTIDVSKIPLRYQGAGGFHNVSMAQVSAAMDDAWATGTADGKFSVTTSGRAFPELLANAEGELGIVVRSGSLAHVELPDAPLPFPVHLFTGDLTVKNQVWKLNTGKLESHDGMYLVSGTESPGTGLNIRLMRGDEQLWSLTGTLLKPNASRADRTQARTAVKP